MARVGRITILVKEDVKDNFHRIADNFGMTESTLGAYVIGKFVYSIMGVDQPQSISDLGGEEENEED